MKFFLVFASVVAVAVAAPGGWSLNQLSEAITSPYTDAALKPVLEDALNIVMEKLFAGENVEPIVIKTQPGVYGSYDLNGLDQALSHCGPMMKPYLESALNQMMEEYWSGNQVESINVQLPALQLMYWSLSDLDAALTNPHTNKELVPYLEQALDVVMAGLFAGHSEAGIAIAVPEHLVAPASPVAPSPVVPSPVVPAPVVPSPVVPAPVVVSPPKAPLVKIIVNVSN